MAAEAKRLPEANQCPASNLHGCQFGAHATRLNALSAQFGGRRTHRSDDAGAQVVGTGRLELPTCRLGGDRSIHLSYVPTVSLL
jgi:hypothetical protein